MRRLRFLLCLLGLVVAVLPARAFVPQTITVDGSPADWDPQNVLEDDRNDTQIFTCGPNSVRPLDLGRIYVTNDANFLYVGVEIKDECFCQMNWGFAIDVNSAGGGTTDPFGRKIGWLNVPFKPDWVVYDVQPNLSGQTGCNQFNYEALYKDTLGTWQNRSTLVNPAYGSGANGLGIVDSVAFKELKLPLSVLGATTGTPLHLEFWITQDSPTKGPLDAGSSDNIQMSRATSTTFDTATVVQMTSMYTYTVQNAVDNIAPTVTSAQAVNFPLLANKQFNLNTNKIDVVFNEPVQLATAQTAANYTFSGPVVRTVISALRDAVAPNIVHLTLNSAINANAAAYQILVQNVQDAAGNAIVNNGTTNVGGFFVRNVAFEGDFRLGLCNGTFAPTDTFTIEGSVNPLTFDLKDNAFMYDANSDSIYTVTVPFTLLRGPGGTGSANLEWKFAHDFYEPLSGNRTLTISSADPATVTLRAAWNNDDPANFTNRPVDVVFQVDATRFNPTGGDVITLLGNAAPLTFTQPGVAMLDNGVAPDAVAGDKIYTARVTFPACAPKNVGWKVDFNGAIECSGQGNRAVFLNDAIFSSANPIVLPARGIDRCEVTDKAVTVVYGVRVDAFEPQAGDSIAVMGDRSPLRFDYPDAGQLMFDNGAGFDTRAGDRIFTRAVTFPDSTPLRVEFKYWKNGVFECAGFGNRSLVLDDVAYSTTTPLVRLTNTWDYCTDPTGVPLTPPVSRPGASFAALYPVMPNPVSRRATFAFDLRRAGRVALSVYDVAGRRVASVYEGDLVAGEHRMAWNGLDLRGARLNSGVYVYELAMGNERVTRRMIVTQ